MNATARPICLHSTQADFAPTQHMAAAAYLGRPRPWHAAPLRLWDCGCGTTHLVRISRAMWMRLVPCSRHYYCRRCGSRVVRLRLRHGTPYGSVYLPAPPLRCDGESLGRIVAGAFGRLNELAARGRLQRRGGRT